MGGEGGGGGGAPLSKREGCALPLAWGRNLKPIFVEYSIRSTNAIKTEPAW